MTHKSSYKLIPTVIDLSVAKDWQEAVHEWEIQDCLEDEDCSSQCICGKEGIRYLFSIRNTRNGKVLYPIGSSCIKKFNRSDLASQVDVYEKLFKAIHEFSQHGYIPFTSDFFSKKLLTFLFEEGCFKASRYNSWHPEKDYNFLLEMFNKRNDPTPAQELKIRALVVTCIVPYLREKLHKQNQISAYPVCGGCGEVISEDERELAAANWGLCAHCLHRMDDANRYD